MAKKLKVNGIYLTTFFCLLISISFIKEMFFFLYDCLSIFGNAVYGIVWVALIVFAIYKLLERVEGIEPWEFLLFSAFVGLLLSLMGLIINGTLGTDKLIEKKYVGIYGTTEEYDSRNDTEIYVEHKTFVFKENDRRAKKRITKNRKKYGESYEHEFIFWQTAFVNGFTPKYISDFTGTNSFSKKLTLFFTVGPIFILETLINSIMDYWILMLIPIIALFLKVKMFEKQIKPFTDVFKSRTKKTAANNVLKLCLLLN